MKWKTVSSYVSNVVLLVIIVGATYGEIKGCYNLLLFITWLLIFGHLFSKFLKNNRMIKVYLEDDGHCPKWFDTMMYGIDVTLLAWFGFFWLAAAWLCIGTIDVNEHHKADKIIKMTNENLEKVMKEV